MPPDADPVVIWRMERRRRMKNNQKRRNWIHPFYASFFSFISCAILHHARS
jgi:hypothetical protein